MAQPPRLPEFDKEKFKDEPLFAVFWELLQPHLKLNARLADRGATVSENLAAGWVDIEVTSTQAYPIRVPSPLAAGQTPYGVLCAGVWDSRNANAAVLGPGGVQPDWVATDDGTILIRKFSGELEGIPFRVRLLVLAR
jgi:hypothetical protein